MSCRVSPCFTLSYLLSLVVPSPRSSFLHYPDLAEVSSGNFECKAIEIICPMTEGNNATKSHSAGIVVEAVSGSARGKGTEMILLHFHYLGNDSKSKLSMEGTNLTMYIELKVF